MHIGIKTRRFLETIWPSWHQIRGRSLPVPLSRGTCQTSSLFLAHVLRGEGMDAFVSQGNDPNYDQGYYHNHSWHGHAWVECSNFIIDITGDQFELPLVHIEELSSDHYKPGSDTANDNAKRKRAELVEAALIVWKSNT